MIKSFTTQIIIVLITALIAMSLSMLYLKRQNRVLHDNLQRASAQIEQQSTVIERHAERRAIEHSTESLPKETVNESLEQGGWFRD